MDQINIPQISLKLTLGWMILTSMGDKEHNNWIPFDWTIWQKNESRYKK